MESQKIVNAGKLLTEALQQLNQRVDYLDSEVDRLNERVKNLEDDDDVVTRDGLADVMENDYGVERMLERMIDSRVEDTVDERLDDRLKSMEGMKPTLRDILLAFKPLMGRVREYIMEVLK